jgi:hypothetical protein
MKGKAESSAILFLKLNKLVDAASWSEAITQK